MADETLQAQWDAAVVGGDLATLERVGPLLFPADGSAPPSTASTAPAPTATPRDFEAEANAIRAEMAKPFASPALQEKLNALYREQYPEGTPDPATTREAWRPDLPPGHTWDTKLVAGFEDTAPGGQSLMHVAADALRSSSRWPDVGAALDSLASRYGDQEAEALLEDALNYAKAHVPEAALANLKRQEVLYAPELIYRTALFWRQSQRGGGH